MRGELPNMIIIDSAYCVVGRIGTCGITPLGNDRMSDGLGTAMMPT